MCNRLWVCFIMQTWSRSAAIITDVFILPFIDSVGTVRPSDRIDRSLAIHSIAKRNTINSIAIERPLLLLFNTHTHIWIPMESATIIRTELTERQSEREKNIITIKTTSAIAVCSFSHCAAADIKWGEKMKRNNEKDNDWHSASRGFGFGVFIH